MKISLYNLYNQLILEEGGRSPSMGEIQHAMNNNYAVNIVYNNGSKDSSNQPRYCRVLAIGKTNRNNPAIRVYQISGPNLKTNPKTGKVERYKTFIIDNIPGDGWRPTKMKFYSPPDELFNTFGDKTLNITSTDGGNIAQFGDEYMDNYRERYANWQSSLKTKQTNEPLSKTRTGTTFDPNSDYEYNKPTDQLPSYSQNVPNEEPEIDNTDNYQDDEDNLNDENL